MLNVVSVARAKKKTRLGGKERGRTTDRPVGYLQHIFCVKLIFTGKIQFSFSSGSQTNKIDYPSRTVVTTLHTIYRGLWCEHIVYFCADVHNLIMRRGLSTMGPFINRMNTFVLIGRDRGFIYYRCPFLCLALCHCVPFVKQCNLSNMG